jgi:lysosomal alpha-mannosidase
LDELVVRELVDDPLKRFIYVESAFFFKWWKDQANSTKTAVYNLVQEGSTR